MGVLCLQFVNVFTCLSLSLTVSYFPGLSLTLPHCFLPSRTVSHRIPHCLSLSLTLLHCFSPSRTVSHSVSQSLTVRHCLSLSWCRALTESLLHVAVCLCLSWCVSFSLCLYLAVSLSFSTAQVTTGRWEQALIGIVRCQETSMHAK